VDSNRTLVLAKSLNLLGTMFPELDTGGAWRARGRELLFQTMDAQIYRDGSHVEQSPGYSLAVADDLLEAYWLDTLNGDASTWSNLRITTLSNLIESYRQFLSPDGNRPAISDTFRKAGYQVFLKAGHILERINVRSTLVNGTFDNVVTSIVVDDASQFTVGDFAVTSTKTEVIRITGVDTNSNTLTIARSQGGTSAQGINNNVTLYNLDNEPFAKPRVRDVWLLGRTRTEPFMNTPSNPVGALGVRGKSFAMTDSGNYILRSGDSDTATQITFDAGQKGGIHGHFDPLNFELWSGGRPLIIDPGPYQYDSSADRAYAISTRAHNTINVDTLNTGALEGDNIPGIIASHNFGANSALITGTHFGYAHVAGQPVVTRNVWYDYGDTMLIVDFVEGTRVRNYQQSFNLPAGTEANPTGVGTGAFRTQYATGGNVRVKPINGTPVRGGLTFVTGSTPGSKLDAYRYTVTKTDDFAVFVTLVNVYTGSAVPDVDAQLLNPGISPGGTASVRLLRDGAAVQTIVFQQPSLTRLASNASPNGGPNDVEYDSSGNLHLVYRDLTDGFLKYSVRDATSSVWSIVQTIDNSSTLLGTFLDLKLDNSGLPGVAYYDGATTDLKFAWLKGTNNTWQVETVDGRGRSAGQYPSLAFSRNSNAPAISYFDRTAGDLKLAQQISDTQWSYTTIDSTGSVGQFTQLRNDPNRTDVNSRYVMSYVDATNNAVKYAYFANTWRLETIKPASLTVIGGYTSLAFEDTGTGGTSGVGANQMQPRIAFYESGPDPSVWFASRPKVGGWSTQRVDGAGTQSRAGLYANLLYNTSNRPELFYCDTKTNRAKRAVFNGTAWSISDLAVGGRELRVTQRGASRAYTNVGGSEMVVNVI